MAKGYLEANVFSETKALILFKYLEKFSIDILEVSTLKFGRDIFSLENINSSIFQLPVKMNIQCWSILIKQKID